MRACSECGGSLEGLPTRQKTCCAECKRLRDNRNQRELYRRLREAGDPDGRIARRREQCRAWKDEHYREDNAEARRVRDKMRRAAALLERRRGGR